jgi:transposase InsO family protein
MKFAFIDAEKADFTIAALCRVLEVTRQGYYAYVSRKPSVRMLREQALHARLRALSVEHQGRYGSPRMHRQLRADGFCVSKRRVERAMRGLGLNVVVPPRWRATTKPNALHPNAPNTLGRDFTASRPNERWVTDITYVWTDEGWAYVAAILDLYSRAVVGWAMSARLDTTLAVVALQAASRRRGETKGLLHHSDRGCQYTSSRYQEALAGLGITASMSRKGNCWDNAVAESFFSTLKRELVARRKWANRSQLRTALFEYLESYYNRRRLHSALGYKTPEQIEREHVLRPAA